MARGDDIEERLIDFAVEIILLCGELPNAPAGRHMSGQILRSGTSPAPNYGEARCAESRKDFIHKLKVVLKELNETGIWLKIIRRSGMLPTERVAPLEAECEELCKIIGSSIKTTRSNLAVERQRHR